MERTDNISANELLQTYAKSAKRWLLKEAAPLWSKRGRTHSGLYPERISLEGQPEDSYFRVFVQARHIFSFVQIGKMGWLGPWAEQVEQTVNVLLDHARRRDGLFVHQLDAEAKILDDRADLYDQAFIMLALAAAGKALNRPVLYDAAEGLLDQLESLWAHPLGGFHEGDLVDSAIRRQNPHMHLFEAFSALYDASGRERFLDAAIAIAELCRRHFVDEASGGLLEYFQYDWRPASGINGQIVEPGHCFEWAWLFERLALEGWQEGTAISDRLCKFSREFGLSLDRGVAVNQILTDGQIQDSQARLWPQTERIKAAISRFRRMGTETEASEAAAAAAGLSQYLETVVPGLWRDKLLPDGRWVDEFAPGSSLYHISCAYAELQGLD
jgi:mannose/cellobiose epimerase-like protein (N-acyl-D-glucosamine 2-epimerase family)